MSPDHRMLIVFTILLHLTCHQAFIWSWGRVGTYKLTSFPWRIRYMFSSLKFHLHFPQEKLAPSGTNQPLCSDKHNTHLFMKSFA